MRLDRYRHPNLSRSEIVFVNKSRRRWCPGVPILGLQPREKAAMLGDQYNRIFSRRIYMKIEFSFQTREMLLFLTTNMAAMTSRANQLNAHGNFYYNLCKGKRGYWTHAPDCLITILVCYVTWLMIHFSKSFLSYWVTRPSCHLLGIASSSVKLYIKHLPGRFLHLLGYITNWEDQETCASLLNIKFTRVILNNNIWIS